MFYSGIVDKDIPGVSHTTILYILCNLSTDIKQSSKRFAGWPRMVLNNKFSGACLISNKISKGKNVLVIALRQAANSIGTQKQPTYSVLTKHRSQQGPQSTLLPENLPSLYGI